MLHFVAFCSSKPLLFTHLETFPGPVAGLSPRYVELVEHIATARHQLCTFAALALHF